MRTPTGSIGRTRWVSIVLTALLVVSVLPNAANADQKRSLTVMTRNLYLGVDLGPLLAAPPSQFFSVAAASWLAVQATNFPERAQALADEIDQAEPDLIGLQEVTLWRTDFPADGPFTPATTIAYDFLQILLDALTARGLHYEAVSTLVNIDAEVPTALGIDVRQTDRDVILVRADLPKGTLQLSNPQAAHFSTNLVIPTGSLGTITVLRGWTAVDVTTRGTRFRFINTHLEAFSEAIRVAQVAELLAGPGDTDLPLVFLGDSNSNADGSGAAYNDLINAGFMDAWASEDAGFTCCQASNLLNPVSALDIRIDLVLSRDYAAENVYVVGAEAGDRTPSGLWPSDHAGVVAILKLDQEQHQQQN